MISIFLAPCPSSGLIINGSDDIVAPKPDIQKLVDRLKSQKGIEINHSLIDGANHFLIMKLTHLTKKFPNTYQKF